jgi:hypothetical protein
MDNGSWLVKPDVSNLPSSAMSLLEMDLRIIGKGQIAHSVPASAYQAGMNKDVTGFNGSTRSPSLSVTTIAPLPPSHIAERIGGAYLRMKPFSLIHAGAHDANLASQMSPVGIGSHDMELRFDGHKVTGVHELQDMLLAPTSAPFQ